MGIKDFSYRKAAVYAGIVLFFLAIAYAYVPQVLSGKIVNQSDIAGWTGMVNEVEEYNAANPDDKSLWTNSMFGGMPTVSIHADFKGDWTKAVYDFLLTGARPASYLFISLIGGFLLFLAFGVNKFIAVTGAVAITFCSYNMQIIQVGHNTKMQAIAFMPWVLAALVFTYKSAMKGIGTTAGAGAGKRASLKIWLPKTMLGAVLFAFALSFQIKANHPQISYYLAIIIFAYVIALFIGILTEKSRKAAAGRFFAASGMLLVIGCIGIATNVNKLLPTYEYAEYSMRGGSELKGDGNNEGGLDLDYATAWSYGLEETANLLIPNFNGGSSSGNPGLRDSETYELLRQARQPNLDEIMDALPLYWGPQPFTAGPMYIGAISIFLFILGMLLLKGRDKWWLFAATLLAVMLSWGSHFMWFTKLWFDFVPLYDKFRTVSMALVILQLTVPVLGFIALDKIVRKGEFSSGKIISSSLWAFGITGGICLLFALFPELAGSFSGAADRGMQDVLAEALAADRRAMLVKDAWRSFALIAAACALILWALRDKKTDGGLKGSRWGVAVAAVGILVFADLVPVDKRYLNGDDFVSRRDFQGQFSARPADKMILEDKALSYRVLDISVNTFNDSHTSYWHKTIGGYSPAKLQRYQDLIEHYLNAEINAAIGTVNEYGTIDGVTENLPYMPVTSMLNGKYIIVDGAYPPVTNGKAMGNCWFVSDVVRAETPDEEIALLGSTDLSGTAVIGRDFYDAAEEIEAAASADGTSTIAEADDSGEADRTDDSVVLSHYAPNELRYSCSLGQRRAVLFSEIYYPAGWKAWIEPAGSSGKVEKGIYRPSDKASEVELFRADWILRGAMLPEGEYELVMRFEPESFAIGENVSRASSIILFILLVLAAAGAVRFSERRRRFSED